jgi:catechol 2,3-dioxygenase-like lactoylglutathione lyase family enzyme
MSIADSGTFHHTCFVVHDVERSASALAESLGIGPWSIRTVEPANCTVRGRDVPFTFRVAVAPVGDSNYELLAPHTGDSIYVEHLATKGEGLHHTCFAYPTPEALQQAKADLSAQGRELVQGGALGEHGEFCYFEIAETGALLELLYLEDQQPPEATIG